MPVTQADKEQRAKEIADHLCDHRFWKTHGRSIKIEDLEGMRLKITDYSKTPDLNDAIVRYHTLLQMTFATNLYKIFETVDSQVMRYLAPQLPTPQQLGIGSPTAGSAVVFDFVCNKCNSLTKVQATLVKGTPLQPGCAAFPLDNKFRCPKCGTEHNLVDARRQIEAQFKKPIVG